GVPAVELAWHLQRALVADYHSHRVPDGVLYVRAAELHADGAGRHPRRGAGGRVQRVPHLLADYAADEPAVAGSAGDAGIYVDLQRLPVGNHPDPKRRAEA